MENGREKLFSYTYAKGFRNFPGLSFILIVIHDNQEVLKPVIALKNELLAVSGVLTTIGILVLLLISRSITSPLKRL